MVMLTREQILARKLGKGVATLPDGSTVQVRALSRDEVLESQDLVTTRAKDNFIIATGMTNPRLTVDEVASWAASSDAGDLVAVSNAIAVISGLAPDSAKRAVKEFEANPDAEFHPLPGAEVGDDGGPAPGGDG